MLNLFERIMYGLSAFVVLGSLALYVIWPPEHRSLDTMPAVTRSKTAAKAGGVPAGSGSKKAGAPGAKPAPTADHQAVIERLTKEQGVRGLAGKQLEVEDYEVPAPVYDYVKREPNMIAELNKAKSELMPGADGRLTRLKLFDIEEDSLFKKFNLQDGDILEFIDGEQVEFGQAGMEHLDRWKRAREKLEAGNSVALTVTRGGQPVQLEFKLSR